MYSKVYLSIYDGSLRKDWKALVTMQQLIILSDSEGYVDMTAEAISSRTTIPRDIIDHGLECLMEPDPESRSQDEEGRRIVLINDNRKWGWRLVNFKEYRDIRNTEDLRAYWRGQKKALRNRPVEEGESAPRWSPPTLEEVKMVCAKSGLPSAEAEKFFNHHSARGWMLGRVKMKSLPHAVGTWKTNWQSGQFSGGKNGSGGTAEKSLQKKIAEQHLRDAERL